MKAPIEYDASLLCVFVYILVIPSCQKTSHLRVERLEKPPTRRRVVKARQQGGRPRSFGLASQVSKTHPADLGAAHLAFHTSLPLWISLFDGTSVILMQWCSSPQCLTPGHCSCRRLWISWFWCVEANQGFSLTFSLFDRNTLYYNFGCEGLNRQPQWFCSIATDLIVVACWSLCLSPPSILLLKNFFCQTAVYSPDFSLYLSSEQRPSSFLQVVVDCLLARGLSDELQAARQRETQLLSDYSDVVPRKEHEKLLAQHKVRFALSAAFVGFFFSVSSLTALTSSQKSQSTHFPSYLWWNGSKKKSRKAMKPHLDSTSINFLVWLISIGLFAWIFFLLALNFLLWRSQ